MVGEDEYLLTRWARNRINKGEVDQIVDTSLIGGISPHSLKLFVEVAETCLHDEPKKRPTMAQVVVQLEFALEQQENRTFSDDVCPSNEENVSSVSTKQLTVAPEDVHNREQTNTKIGNGDSPAAKEERRKSKIYKPLRFRTWDAFWNRVTPVKKRAHRSISGINIHTHNQFELLHHIQISRLYFSPGLSCILQAYDIYTIFLQELGKKT